MGNDIEEPLPGLRRGIGLEQAVAQFRCHSPPHRLACESLPARPMIRRPMLPTTTTGEEPEPELVPEAHRFTVRLWRGTGCAVFVEVNILAGE